MNDFERADWDQRQTDIGDEMIDRADPTPPVYMPPGYRISTLGLGKHGYVLERKGHVCDCYLCTAPEYVWCGTYETFDEARIDAFILNNDPLPQEATS